MPFQLKNTYHAPASCADISMREALYKQSVAQGNLWLRAMYISGLRCNIDNGRALSRSKKLFKLTSLILDDGTRCTDTSVICRTVALYFGKKWGSDNLQQRSLARDFVHRSEGMLPSVSELDVEICLYRLKRATGWTASCAVWTH